MDWNKKVSFGLFITILGLFIAFSPLLLLFYGTAWVAVGFLPFTFPPGILITVIGIALLCIELFTTKRK